MKSIIIFSAGLILLFLSCSQTNKPINSTTDLVQQTPQDSSWNKLTKEEENVIVYKGTERPWTGEYVKSHAVGTYHCKRCDAALFASDSKFESGTGWPSFDDFIDSSVELVEDADGFREEIVCANCKGHLGHVFYKEGFTDKETRHCVNSVSLSFVPKK